MIRVRFEENRLTVCGHAGYAARGEDIVCAAVSALVYALIGDLQERGLEQLQARYGEFVSVETTVHGS